MSLVSELAMARLTAAGWDSNWPFIMEDLRRPGMLKAIRADPSLSVAEKKRILEFAPGGRRYNEVLGGPQPVSNPNLEWAGIKAARQKSLARYEEGRGGAVPFRETIGKILAKRKEKAATKRAAKLYGEKGAKMAEAEVAEEIAARTIPTTKKAAVRSKPVSTSRIDGPARKKLEGTFGGAMEWGAKHLDYQTMGAGEVSDALHRMAEKSGVDIATLREGLTEMGVPIPLTGVSARVGRSSAVSQALKSRGLDILTKSAPSVEQGTTLTQPNPLRGARAAQARRTTTVRELKRTLNEPMPADVERAGRVSKMLQSPIAGFEQTPLQLVEAGRATGSWQDHFAFLEDLQAAAAKASPADARVLRRVIDEVSEVPDSQRLSFVNAERVEAKQAPLSKAPAVMVPKRSREIGRTLDTLDNRAASLTPEAVLVGVRNLEDQSPLDRYALARRVGSNDEIASNLVPEQREALRYTRRNFEAEFLPGELEAYDVVNRLRKGGLSDAEIPVALRSMSAQDLAGVGGGGMSGADLARIYKHHTDKAARDIAGNRPAQNPFRTYTAEAGSFQRRSPGGKSLGAIANSVNNSQALKSLKAVEATRRRGFEELYTSGFEAREADQRARSFVPEKFSGMQNAKEVFRATNSERAAEASGELAEGLGFTRPFSEYAGPDSAWKLRQKGSRLQLAEPLGGPPSKLRGLRGGIAALGLTTLASIAGRAIGG